MEQSIDYMKNLLIVTIVKKERRRMEQYTDYNYEESINSNNNEEKLREFNYQ